MSHTHFPSEVTHHYEPGPWLKALIYVALAVFAVGAPIAIASAIFGSETVVYWIADIVS